MATEILVKDLRQAFAQARERDGSMAERLDVFAHTPRGSFIRPPRPMAARRFAMNGAAARSRSDRGKMELRRRKRGVKRTYSGRLYDRWG